MWYCEECACEVSVEQKERSEKLFGHVFCDKCTTELKKLDYLNKKRF